MLKELLEGKTRSKSDDNEMYIYRMALSKKKKRN